MGRFFTALLVSLLTAVPSPGVSTSRSVYELGMRIAIDVPGRIMGIRFWRLPDDAGPHVGHIWSTTGQELAKVTFVNETVSGWQQQMLSTPLDVLPGQIMVSVNSTGGHFAVTVNGLAVPLMNGPLSSPASSGSYGQTGGYPLSTSPNNYYRDVVFDFDDRVGTITIIPVATGGFMATLDGFAPGLYTLGVSMKSVAGIVTTATRDITMPALAEKGAPE
jgi:hypothetical protein